MIGKRIQELRKRRKLTQAEAAKGIGIVRSTYSNYEADKREPDIETLTKIAEFYEVPVSSIIENNDHSKENIPIFFDTNILIDMAKRVKQETGIDVTDDPIIMEEVQSYMVYLAQKKGKN